MSRLARTFEALRARGEAAFIPFVTCGDPDLATTRDLALAYIEAGADILEIGIPLTDPLPDGPTIHPAPGEGAEWVAAGQRPGVDSVFLLAPAADDARVERVAQSASGFIYAVARLGVTGARTDVPPEIGELVARVRRFSSTPVCAGFGF